MTLTTHFGALLCVALIAAGQILFKTVAVDLPANGAAPSARLLALGTLALTLYGVATIFWILLLRSAPLGKLYPYMALSFVFVAAASWLLFGEAIGIGYLSGLALIVTGLVVIAMSSGP